MARYPKQIAFDHDTLLRTTKANGDNRCITWAADDSQITALGGGDFAGVGPGHSRLVRIRDGADDRDDVAGFPRFAPSVEGAGSFFTYGVLSLDGVLYAASARTQRSGWSPPFRGIKLLASSDNGRTWA